jgi:hypothetical protein
MLNRDRCRPGGAPTRASFEATARFQRAVLVLIAIMRGLIVAVKNISRQFGLSEEEVKSNPFC